MFSCVGGERLLRHKGQQELAIFIIAHDGAWTIQTSASLCKKYPSRVLSQSPHCSSTVSTRQDVDALFDIRRMQRRGADYARL